MQPEPTGALELVPGREVQKVLRPAIQDGLAASGFTSTASAPEDLSHRPRGWCLQLADSRFVVVSLQLDSKGGFSRHWGGRFTLRFELSSRPVPITSMKTAHLWKLLDRAHRKNALEIQRRVVSSLPDPPELIRRNFYGSRFAPPRYWPWEDVWLRYSTSEHIQIWAQFLRQSLPSAAKRFLTSPNGRPFDQSIQGADPRDRERDVMERETGDDAPSTNQIVTFEYRLERS